MISPRAALTETESNNTRATADKVTVGSTITGYVNPKGDIDCFLLIPSVSQKVTFKLTGPSDKDFDLWLQDNTGALLAKSAGSTSTETITYNVVKGVQYYAVVNSGVNHFSSSSRYTLSITGSATSGTSKTIAVTPRKQEGTYWCWATTVQMIAETEGYYKEQSAIVTSIKGSPVDKIGYADEQAKALKLINATKFKNADYDNCSDVTQYKRWVSDSILAGKPVSIACEPVSSGIGHSVLAYSVDTSEDTVGIIDPKNGGRYRCSVSQILKGFSGSLSYKIRSSSAIHY